MPNGEETKQEGLKGEQETPNSREDELGKLRQQLEAMKAAQEANETVNSERTRANREALCVNVGETIAPREIREGGEARTW